ncbi:MAG: 50S ribosomal protein L29 [Deltaproteobacteria bacterium]|nr:50S ribosomal protein L29 [Deltaproteobacteria bacterium]
MKASELRELTLEELRAKEEQLRREHFTAKVKHATGQLENTARLRLLRRDIARVETVLRARAGASR